VTEPVATRKRPAGTVPRSAFWMARAFGFVWVGLVTIVAELHAHVTRDLTAQIIGYTLIGLAFAVWAFLDLRSPEGTPAGRWLAPVLAVMAAVAGFTCMSDNGALLVLFAGIAVLVAGGDVPFASALCVAANAVWDEKQQCFMHGAVAWRTRLLGWRGQYSGDALGWHERTAAHFASFAKQQNTSPIPEAIPGADEQFNLARSEAALRRYFKTATENPVVSAGPLSVDLVGRAVSLNKTQIRLTRKEYRLLHVLAMHVGLVVTHDQLLKEIWSGNQRDNIQYLRILVRKLRQKIETDPNHPRLLVTESGVGYRLQARLEDSSVG